MRLYRHKSNFLSSWWWTLDHLTAIALLIIIAFSAVMAATSSPPVAERLGLESFYFVRKQLIYLCLALAIIFMISCCSPRAIYRISVIGFSLCLILLILVMFYGVEIKGSKRWLHLGSFSMQPSEFIKPFFAIITGWILSLKFSKAKFPAFSLSIALYCLLVSMLILQPDFGMTVTISAVWSGQLFLAGLPIGFIIVFLLLACVGLVSAYHFLPHVTKRIDSFLDPSLNENYQVKKSLEAFSHGGFYGTGPGEGTIKQSLPDAHTDFIFAVIGEELGAITCLVIIALFAFIVFRSFYRLVNETNHYIVFAAAGLLMQLGIQAIINIGVTLHLLPTKGMTLPFISYGGSSMLTVAITMGMILALTRRRYGIVRIRSKDYKL